MSLPNNIWGLNGEAQKLTGPDEIVILVGQMESDDAEPDHVMKTAEARVAAAALPLVAAGTARPELVKALLSERREGRGQR
jgi:hypothetical protein